MAKGKENISERYEAKPKDTELVELNSRGTRSTSHQTLDSNKTQSVSRCNQPTASQVSHSETQTRKTNVGLGRTTSNQKQTSEAVSNLRNKETPYDPGCNLRQDASPCISQEVPSSSTSMLMIQSEAVARAAEFVEESIIEQLRDSQWKSRLEGVTELTKVVEGMDDADLGQNIETIVALLQHYPSFSESFVQILEKMFNLIMHILTNSPQLSTQVVSVMIEGLVEKIHVAKLKATCFQILMEIAERHSLQFVFSQIYCITASHKTSKTVSELIDFLTAAIIEFGISGLDIQQLITHCKILLESTNPAIKKSVMALICELSKYLGRESLCDSLSALNPILLTTISKEFDKVNGMKPAVPKHRQISPSTGVPSVYSDSRMTGSGREKVLSPLDISPIMKEELSSMQPTLSNQVKKTMSRQNSDGNQNTTDYRGQIKREPSKKPLEDTPESTEPIFRNSLKEMREKANQQSSWPQGQTQPAHVNQLREQMKGCVSVELHGKLFSPDVKKWIGVLDDMKTLLSTHKEAIIDNVDVILKWATWKLCETSMHAEKVLLFLVDLFQMLQDVRYKVTDYEASVFFSIFIERVSNTTAKAKLLVSDILKLLLKIYPASKVMKFLVASLRPDSVTNVWILCLSEMRSLISQQGTWVCTLHTDLPVIVQCLNNGDTIVQSAALTLLNLFYANLGEEMWNYIPDISSVHKLMIQKQGQESRQQGQESRQLQGQESRQLQGQENRLFQGQESKQLQGQENRQLQGQESKQLQGQDNRQLQGQESKQLQGQENRQLQGQESRKLQGQETKSKMPMFSQKTVQPAADCSTLASLTHPKASIRKNDDILTQSSANLKTPSSSLSEVLSRENMDSVLSEKIPSQNPKTKQCSVVSGVASTSNKKDLSSSSGITIPPPSTSNFDIDFEPIIPPTTSSPTKTPAPIEPSTNTLPQLPIRQSSQVNSPTAQIESWSQQLKTASPNCQSQVFHAIITFVKQNETTLVPHIDELVDFLIEELEEMFSSGTPTGRMCKYIVKTLMTIYERRPLVTGISESSLLASLKSLSGWSFDSRVLELEEGDVLQNAFNHLLLRVLSNSDISLLVLLNELRESIPPFSLETASKPYSKYTTLLMKCLVNLKKHFPSTFSRLDVPHVMYAIHLFLTRHPPFSWKDRDHAPFNMVLSIHTDIVKLKQKDICNCFNLVPVSAQPPPAIVSYTLGVLRKMFPDDAISVSALQMSDAMTGGEIRNREPNLVEFIKLSSYANLGQMTSKEEIKKTVGIIFKKIATKSEQGFADLLVLRYNNPKIDIDCYLKCTHPQFQLLVEQGLKKYSGININAIFKLNDQIPLPRNNQENIEPNRIFNQTVKRETESLKNPINLTQLSLPSTKSTPASSGTSEISLIRARLENLNQSTPAAQNSLASIPETLVSHAPVPTQTYHSVESLRERLAAIKKEY